MYHSLDYTYPELRIILANNGVHFLAFRKSHRRIKRLTLQISMVEEPKVAPLTGGSGFNSWTWTRATAVESVRSDSTSIA